MLRENWPLQAIRKALNNLRDLGAVEHLSPCRLVTQGQRDIVLVADADTGTTELIAERRAEAAREETEGR